MNPMCPSHICAQVTYTPYILPEELQTFLSDDKDENVSVLHLNITSVNKNFENFKMFLLNLNYNFSIICFS